jgi:hypothetical protein
MTWPELALVAGLLALLLTVTAGLYDHYLNTAKVQQVTALIQGLARAAAAYAEATGSYPPGRRDEASDPILATLLTVPASAAQVHALSSSLLFVADGKWHALDPWGRPVRYLTQHSERAEPRRRVEANGGVPVFECAGPDRDFGDAEAAGQTDNIASDEPR